MFMKHYAPNGCETIIEVIMKMGVQWGMCQGGCERERRIEVFVKIQKKYLCLFFSFFFFLVGGEGGGGVGLGVRVDVNEELKFL